MNIRYLAALLLALALCPASLVIAATEDDIEAQEQSMYFTESDDDQDNYMNAPVEDPAIDDGDIDEDTSDEQD